MTDDSTEELIKEGGVLWAHINAHLKQMTSFEVSVNPGDRWKQVMQEFFRTFEWKADIAEDPSCPKDTVRVWLRFQYKSYMNSTRKEFLFGALVPFCHETPDVRLTIPPEPIPLRDKPETLEGKPNDQVGFLQFRIIDNIVPRYARELLGKYY